MGKVRFELIGGNTSPMTIIPTQHSKFNDLMVMHKGKRRELRYCENEPSIWKDEQNKDSEATLIMIQNGILEVDEDENSTLVDFLKTSPYLGSRYEIVDLAEKATEKLNKEELIHEAKDYIFKADDKQLQNVAKVLIPSHENEAISVIKTALITFAETRPEEIISKFKTKDAVEETELEAQVKMAFDKEVLVVNDEKTEILWGVNKELVVVKKADAEAVKIAVNFFKTAKNKEHKELLIQRLSE